MPEHSWSTVAEAVADGLHIASGDKVGVFLTDAGSFAIVESFCAAVYRRGAVPHVLLTDERLDTLGLRFASSEVLESPSAIEMASLRESDVHVSFRGMLPPAGLEGFSEPEVATRVAALRRAKGQVSSARWEKGRWALVRVPTREWSEFIGVCPDVLFEEFFAGCLMDWSGALPAWQALAERIDQADTLRIISSDTDLSLGVTGRRAVVFAGEANWPDGEIATAPLDDRVDGHIVFSEPFYFAGERVEGLRLDFEDGLVKEVNATTGSALATALLDTDDGSRRVGELGIGLNAGMRTMTGDLLFDEKILGTAHIALGRAYPQCGGTNQSSLHWDIVKDLRPSSGGGAGSILLDGVPIIENGLPTW
ncbi:aminopeptidase [Subtercola sp. PAMC28395]|uniref:aminopeptidase n=1 Tax=Subtercola sp. PAMC28395 TaxID=2846775 RepID=UPI001C0E4C96|nr:aminopeptidase [Subtercola sp. PAMC28395]QWT24170.1 aminopeptidase [Subtercola sp. PAMC28395]